jgi:hypothetical protein
MGVAPPGSFFRRLVSRLPVSKKDDPADMGTVFGLEASLGPVSRFQAKDVGATAGMAPVGEDPPMGWLGRPPKRKR